MKKGFVEDGGMVKRDFNFKTFSELVAAVVDMHKEDIIHQDIKPENILVHKDSIKLGDFGCAKDLQ